MELNKNAYRNELETLCFTGSGREALTDALMDQSAPAVRRPRWVKRGAAAALAAALLVGTAMAAAGPVWETFFGHLDEDQQEVIETLSQELPAAESNGTVMTPLAAFGDQDFYYLMLEIRAPEGTVLPDYGEDEGFYQFFNPDTGERMTLTNGAGEDIGGGRDYDWMERSGEDDPLTVVIRFWPSEDVDFSDGTDKILHIPGLWVQSPYKIYTPVLTGGWDFNIGIHTGGIESRTLDVSGITTEHELCGTLTLDSLRISPLGMRWRYHWTAPEKEPVPSVEAVVGISGEDGEAVEVLRAFMPGAKIAVVMEDGREISLSGTMGSCDEDACWNESYAPFEAPIDLGRAVAVRWGTAEIPLK